MKSVLGLVILVIIVLNIVIVILSIIDECRGKGVNYSKFSCSMRDVNVGYLLILLLCGWGLFLGDFLGKILTWKPFK